MLKTTAKDQARTICRARFDSASRGALACAIVGLTALYGPTRLMAQIKFLPLSYLMVILTLSNSASTLGHSVRGFWHILFATIQVVPIAALGQWLAAPAAVAPPLGVAAVVAAVAAFLVVLPRSTHVTAKRIALAQITLVCTELVVGTHDTRYGFMNPLHIAASAGLGAFSSLLALLLPLPGFAHFKVKKLCKVYEQNVSERMDIYLRALNSEDRETKIELVLRGKPLAEIGTKLLQSIKILEEGMVWEKPWKLLHSKHDSLNIEQRLQSIELPIRAMEHTLISSSSLSVQLLLDQQNLSTLSQDLSAQLHNKFQKILPFRASKESQQTTTDESTRNLSLKHVPTFPTPNHEPSCFFFSCIDTLLEIPDNATETNGLQKTEHPRARKPKSRAQKLEPAIKYSVALGLSVLLGVILEKENACWAGLMVATSFTAGRPAVFTAANARGQGTAIGSVYGLVCCFIFHQPEIRLLAFLPWIVFTGFLKHSKMYGPAGGVSAAVAALFILGRKGYGPPNEFAIDRLTSVFIGLFCLVLVELAIQPVRAATLARRHLLLTLVSFQELLREMGFCYDGGKNGVNSKFKEFREKQRVLKCLVQDAESEPDFWYLPFHGSCYKRVVVSLSNMANILFVATRNLEMLSGLKVSLRGDMEQQLDYEMGVLLGTVDSLLEMLSPSKRSEEVDCEEMDGEVVQNTGLISEEEIRIAIEEDYEDSDNEVVGERMDIYLKGVVFCISCLRKEMDQIEVCVKEIVGWGI
ncbi:Unknown protein [Striga hermonthica]|uniref:Integral membrane bound transporter domain-containing protein n=1 Tax=Striga hermonthica TaxID=68872 RepID=A0A9N7NRU8_STRHE|nr:Unknown protein [Striga hermonthica]